MSGNTLAVMRASSTSQTLFDIIACDCSHSCSGSLRCLLALVVKSLAHHAVASEVGLVSYDCECMCLDAWAALVMSQNSPRTELHSNDHCSVRGRDVLARIGGQGTGCTANELPHYRGMRWSSVQ